MSVQGRPASIVKVVGDEVLVSIPLVGFPKGFEVQPGQRVMVMVEDAGLAAIPMLTTVDLNSSCEDLAKTGEIVINGEPHVCQPGTAHNDPNSTKRATVYVMDHGTANGPKHILGSRPRL